MSIPIDGHYIPAFSIEDVLLDKDTGAPLAGGLVYFYEDNQRSILKPVYQITGTSPNYTFTQLPNPMVLSSIGTFEDALDNPTIPYFYPFDDTGAVDLYFVNVLNSNSVPQFNRQAQPYIPEDFNPVDVTASGFTNELSNPQFASVLFDTTTGTKVITYSSATLLTTNIAPDWDLIVTGTGTVTLSQITPAGSLNVPTNPGTILGIIASAGISLCQLRQRLTGSPGIWSGGNISATLVAASLSPGTPMLTMSYNPSAGSPTSIPLLTANLDGSNTYLEFYSAGSIAIPASTSPNTFPTAYVDIILNIPPNTNLGITSIQVSFTGSESITALPYDQETNARQIDHQFNYDRSRLNFKAIPSMLVGWDFPLNPAQFIITSFSTTPIYVWDQTICASAVGTVNVTKSTSTGAFAATTNNGTEAFYMLQYLSGNSAIKTTLSNLSVNINAYLSNNAGVIAKVFLYYSSGGGTIPLLSSGNPTIGTIDATGNFSLTTSGVTWTLIGQLNANASSGILTQTSNVDIGLSGWNGKSNFGITTTNNFAIVVTFAVPTSGTVVNVESISLVPGDIPTRPAPQSIDEVLRECEHYYEKSWDTVNSPASLTDTGSIICPMTVNPISGAAGVITCFANEFGFPFRTYKRIVSGLLSLYSPQNISAGFVENRICNAGTVQASPTNVAVGNWANPLISQKSAYFRNNGTSSIGTFNTGATAISGATATIEFQYIIDCRLGVI